MLPSPSPPLDDAAVWQRIRQGDEGAFSQVYRQHAGRLYRFAARLTGSVALAEDVLQDVFVALVDRAARTAPGGYDPAQGGLRSYLYGAVRNRALKRLREADRRSPAGADHIGHRTDDDTQALRDALMKLDPDFREVVLLCELEGLQYEEAAQALGIPVGTVRSRLARARARLLALLSDEPATPSVRKEAR
jgi:RNA polymerase sigma-70 factor, ECF subfamily